MNDLIGHKFGRLTVLSSAPDDPRPGNWWNCICECGTFCVRKTGVLQDRSRHNQSCGCAKRDSIQKAAAAAWAVTTKFSHQHKQRLTWILGGMLRRCHRPGSRRWERYGGRGISVCEEWRKNHTAFFEWAVANGYQEGLSIERKNRDGNYEPSNCCWADDETQANNTSRNRFLTWNGETLTVAQWTRKLDIGPRAMQHRVDRGWSVERIFTQPYRKR